MAGTFFAINQSGFAWRACDGQFILGAGRSSFRFSVFSPAAHCLLLGDGELLMPWLGATGGRSLSPKAKSLDESIPEAAVNAWDRIRLELAIAPFQVLARPTCEDDRIMNALTDGEASVSIFRHVGTLGRFDPDAPPLYVRTRHFAPALGRFLPRDPA